MLIDRHTDILTHMLPPCYTLYPTIIVHISASNMPLPLQSSFQGEKVVPESINRLHEIAREVEDRKQQLLGTTVQAAMAPSADTQAE